jgi:ribosomal protein S18 acetylase RimI-like enzyme
VTVLIEAVERDFVAAWWLLAEAAGEELHDGPVRWYHTGQPDSYCNQVLETHLPDGDADELIDATLDRLRALNAPFNWWVMPSSTPADLAARLHHRGLIADTAWPGMALRVGELVQPPAVPGLEIQQVTSDDDLAVYAGIFAPLLSASPAFTDFFLRASRGIGFGAGVPEEHFVGRLDGQPVATVSLLTAGGAAGIYNVATIEAARGRGIGAAMTAAAIHRGAGRGFRVATLQASTMGRRVYERLGFRFVCDLVPYRSPR